MGDNANGYGDSAKRTKQKMDGFKEINWLLCR